MILLALACLLGGVPVAGDCEAAQRYAPLVANVPPEHWAYVAEIEMNMDGTHGRAEYGRRRIILPATGGEAVLYHEVGHLVFYELQLYGEWAATFGRAGGEYRERAAEAYKRYLLGKHLEEPEQQWIDRYVMRRERWR